MNEESFRTAYVFVNDTFSAILKETEFGYSFSYDKNYLNSEKPLAVSLTLPLSETEYKSKTLLSFFDGLIPEGWLLNIATKNWKIDYKDRFGLLLAVCEDCIGNVSIRRSRT